LELELNIKFKNYSSLGSISGPMIVKNKVQLPFSSEFVGSTSASLNFEVTGLNLTNNIVITAPAGFIINTNNTNANQSPINLAPSSGNVPTTIIYVKFKPVAGIVYNANISLTSIGATSRSINVIGLGLVDTAPVYNPATIDISQPTTLKMMPAHLD